MTEMPRDQREFNRNLIAEFRANGGKLDGRPLLVLTTTGIKTGEPRPTPMMYLRLDDRLLVIASNNGAPKDPDWFRNLVAEPTVTVEVDGEQYEATARPAIGEDRDALFARITEQFPFFAEHQSGISRDIPVVELTRV